MGGYLAGGQGGAGGGGGGFGLDMDALAVGLNGLSLNPNPNLAPMLAERRKEKRSRAAANETARYIRESLGRDDLAGLLEAGALDPETAIEMASPKEKDLPSLVETYEYFKGLGLSHEDALAAAKSGAGGSTNEFNITNGAEYGDIEKGWRRRRQTNPDGSVTEWEEPIPGSKAERLEQEAAAAEEAAATKADVADDQADTYTSVAVQTVDDILMKIDPETNPELKKSATGTTFATGGLAKTVSELPIVGNMMPYKDVSVLLNSLKGAIAFDRLQALRNASPTGGALGAVTEKEMELLMGALGPLAPDMNDRDLLIRNLKEVKKIMRKFAAYPNAGAALVPPGDPGAPAPGAPDDFAVEGAY